MSGNKDKAEGKTKQAKGKMQAAAPGNE